MSMSAEQVLLNCQKQFDFIKTDIKTLLKYVNEILEHCREIDNSNFFEEKIQELLLKVKNEEQELLEMEKKVASFSKDVHIATESYHEIQRYAEKKRARIATLKSEFFIFKKDVVQKEQEMLVKNLQKSLQKNISDFKDEIISKFTKLDDKVLIKKYFDDNEPLFINKTNEEVLQLTNDYLVQTRSSAKFLAKNMINQTISLYSEDADIVNAIKANAQTLLENINDQNIFAESEKFFTNSARNAEKEYLRKDAVIKIVRAIREVGYVVNEQDIRRLSEKDVIIIKGEKPSGETASFAVRLDGSFVYNYEGFEGHEHDVDADAFLQELYKQGIQSTDQFNKQYREPKFVAKQKEILKQMKKKDK